MGLIYLQKCLSNKGLKELYEQGYSNRISEVNNLSGFALAQGDNVRGLILPRLSFKISNFSYSSLISFLDEKKDRLELDIQDCFSLKLESRIKNLELAAEDLRKEGVEPIDTELEYFKQTGIYTLQREQDFISENIMLNEPYHQKRLVCVPSEPSKEDTKKTFNLPAYKVRQKRNG